MNEKTMDMILLFEKDSNSAISRKKIIEKKGFTVIIPPGFHTAVKELAENHAIGLLLIDISFMADKENRETVQQIHENHDLPIVFLTSASNRRDLEKIETITSYGFIDKDSDETLQIETLKKAVKLFNRQKELQEHVNRNEAIIRVLPDLLFVIDKDGIYREVHASEEKLLALPPDKLIGKSLLDVFPKETADRFLEVFRVCLETGELQKIDYELPIEGQVRSFEAHITKYSSDSILSIVHDSTARKEARRKIENLNSLLMSIRSINQLIVQEDDFFNVIKSSCEILVETWQYLNIEISLLDEKKGKIIPLASAGKLGHGDWYLSLDGTGNAPRCINDAFQAKKTTILNDYFNYCTDCQYFNTANPHKKIIIPMMQGKQPIGLFCVCTTPEQIVFTEEIELLEEVAADLVYARDKHKAEKGVKEKNDLLTVLNEYSLELAAVPVSDEIFPVITHRLKNITRAKIVSISTYDKESSTLNVQYTTLSSGNGKSLTKLLGRRIEDISMKVTPKMYNKITTEVVGDAGTLSETTLGSISKTLSSMIHKFFGIEWFTGIALLHNEQLIGTVIIVGDKDSVRPDNEDLKAFAGVTANALQRWRSEKSLLESRGLWEFALEGTGDGIWDWNLETAKISYSGQWGKMLGYDDGFLDNTHYQKEKLIHPEDLPEYQNRLQEHLEGSSGQFSFEYRMLCNDGSYKWVLDRGKIIERGKSGKPLRMIGVQTDISYIKKTEEELKHSEILNTTIVNNTYDGIILQDAQGRIITLNNAAVRILGIEQKEMFGHFTDNPQGITIKEDHSVYPKEEHPSIITLTTGKPCKNEIMGIKKESGDITWININTIPLFKDNGRKPYAVVVSFSDITERKKANEELKESEKRYRLLFQYSKDAMMTVEPPSWKFTSGNAAIFEVFKVRDLAEFTACEPWRLSPEKQPDGQSSEEKAKKMIEKAMQEGYHFFEWTHKRLNGEEFPATVLLTRIEMSGKPFLHATVRDISERKRDETIKRIQVNIAHAVSTAGSLYELYDTVRKELGTLLDTKNCFIAFLDEKTGIFSTPFEKDDLESITSWIADKSITGYVLKQKKPVLLNKEETEKMAEAGIFERIGTTAESWLGVPIKIGGSYKAVFVVQSYTEKDVYDEHSVELMELIADQLSIYIEHKQAEEKPAEERSQLLSIFDGIEEAIYISDPQTHEILYVNKFLKNTFGKELVGGLCYHELQNKESPCEFCTNDIILNNKGASHSWEYHNPLLKRDFLITDKLITWSDGRAVRFELARDITERKKALVRIEDLNSLLLAIRNVNQMIVQEDDLLKIMQDSCEILLETRQYLNVEISLLDDTNKLIKPVASSGDHERGVWKIDTRGAGDAPDCVRNAVLSLKSLIINDPEKFCSDCPGYAERCSHESVVIPIFQKEDLIGLMRTCMIPGHTITQDEIELLEEVAGDLGFARAKITAEENLKTSELLFRNIYENATIGIYRTTPDGKILLANQSLIGMLGYDSFADLADRNLETGFYEASYSRKDFIRRLEKEGFIKGMETTWQLKDGSTMHVLESVRLIRDEKGKHLFYEGTVEDITSLKETEISLRESQKSLDTFFSQSLDGYFFMMLDEPVMWNDSVDKEKVLDYVFHHQRITKANQAMLNQFLTVKEDFLGQTPNDLFIHDLDHGFQIWRGLFDKGRQHIEINMRRADGTPIQVMGDYICMYDEEGRITGSFGIQADITESKRDELIKEVQYNIAHAVVTAYDFEELYETVRLELGKLLDTTNFYIARYDSDTGLFKSPFHRDERDSINTWEAEKSLTGYALKKGKSLLVNKEDILALCEQGLINTIGAVAENWLGVPINISGSVWGMLVVQSYEDRETYDANSVRILELIANQLSLYLERMLGKEELLESERKQAALLANLPGMSYRCQNDKNWTMDFVSEGCLELTGYKADELIGNRVVSYNDLIFPEYRDTLWKEWQDVLARKKAFTGEYRILTKEGQEKWVWERGSGVFSDTGDLLGLEGFITDVSDRKQAEIEREDLETKLIQSQKMDAIGRLAGGVAHDFNNMLGVILGHTEMLLEKTEKDNPLYVSLEEINKATERSADLTKQLLAFARKQTVFPKVINLNTGIEEMLKMLKRLIGENIDLSWQPAADLWFIKIDYTQLHQILTNLCINSRDAIHDIGRIAIKTENITFDSLFCEQNPRYSTGEFVMLSVIDNGCGMDKETLKNIFEPFFTSKGVGEGSGLGLATVYGIVQQNNGFVDVYSEPNEGTAFKIYFPRHQIEHQAVAKEIKQELSIDRGHETILLVEDEISILEMVQSMLENTGYRVFSAHSPKDAILLAEKYKNDIKLLVTDMIMPHMNGYDLAMKLKSELPSLKVLFMSGYIDHAIKHNDSLDVKVNYIQKPFSFKKFLTMVRSLLDS